MFRTLRRWLVVSTVVAGGHNFAAAQQQALQITNTVANPNGYLRIADAPDLRVQQYTLEAWITPTGNGFGVTTDPYGATVLGKSQEGQVGTYLASWSFNWCPASAGKLYFVHRNQQGTGTLGFSNSGIALNTTAHVAMSFDGASIRIYINGVLDREVAAIGTGVFYDASSVLIGAANFGAGFSRRFSGVIDDVRIWNHARSASEIAAAMNCRLSGAESGLVAYYTFNGASLSDATGHGHTALQQGTNVSFVGESVALGVSCASGVAYCTSGTTSNGCLATLHGVGAASASASSPFVLTATSVEGNKAGLFFYSVSGSQAAPWGTTSSLLCVKPPTQRTALQQSGGTNGLCDGDFELDWRAYILGNPAALGTPFSAGDTVWAQAWFRDPPSPKTTALSNAFAFVVGP
jgi:hypothetical protein